MSGTARRWSAGQRDEARLYGSIRLSVRQDSMLPADTRASVELPSALGNPFVRLSPNEPDGADPPGAVRRRRHPPTAPNSDRRSNRPGDLRRADVAQQRRYGYDHRTGQGIRRPNSGKIRGLDWLTRALLTARPWDHQANSTRHWHWPRHQHTTGPRTAPSTDTSTHCPAGRDARHPAGQMQTCWPPPPRWPRP